MQGVGFAICALTGALALNAPPKVADEIHGRTVGVTDGDTITVLVEKATIRVRLEGIDAPESSQSYGTKSKQALSEFVFGKAVTVGRTGTDRYGRTLGYVVVGGLDVNARMVEDGWAWHFKQYND